VRALLGRVEVDEAFELRVEELRLGAAGADAYDFFDPSYPNARKTEMGCGTSCLDVLEHWCFRRRHAAEDSYRKKCLSRLTRL
jgi:hypothetical protein